MGRPTMEDVAAAAGVSRSLVSLVFQDSPKVSPASRERVLEAAERLGYRPNVLARNLASTRTRTIGILLDDLHNPYFADVLDAVENAAEGSGYRALLADGRRDGARELDAVRTFIDHRVDGIVLASPRVAEKDLASLARLAPLVSIERDIDVPRVDVVMHDARVGAQLVIDHLAQLGHRRIAHVDGGPGAGAALRRDAYIDAMTEAGLAGDIDIIAAEFTEEAGRRAAEDLIARMTLPTAVFCGNDYSAAGMAGVFMRAGLAIPGDIALVGYDDTTLAELGLLSLTSVRQPLDDMAKIAIELINSRVERPNRKTERVTVAPTLIARASTVGYSRA